MQSQSDQQTAICRIVMLYRNKLLFTNKGMTIGQGNATAILIPAITIIIKVNLQHMFKLEYLYSL